jgi:hypothetical protein
MRFLYLMFCLDIIFGTYEAYFLYRRLRPTARQFGELPSAVAVACFLDVWL